jgi:hypothetical protein
MVPDLAQTCGRSNLQKETAANRSDRKIDRVVWTGGRI